MHMNEYIYIDHPVLGQIKKCCDNTDLYGCVIDTQYETNKPMISIKCKNCSTAIVAYINKDSSLRNFVQYIVSEWNRSAEATQQKELLKRRREIEQQHIEDQIYFIQRIGGSNDI